MTDRQTALAVGVAAFVVYVITLAPTFLWSDSAKLAIFVHEKSFSGTSFGDHPMHTIIGYVFSWLPFSLAYTQNLMSAFFAALSVSLLYLALTRITKNRAVAILTSGAIAVSHLFWMYAVINETYSLLAFTLCCLLVLAQKWQEEGHPRSLYLIALIAGAGFANHAETLLFLPGILILIWNRELLRLIASARVAILLTVFVIGSSPVLLLPLFTGATPVQIAGGLRETMSGHYDIFFGAAGKLAQQVLRYPAYLCYQFPAAFPLGIGGAILLARRETRFFWGTFAIWLTVILFASQYFLQRQFPLLIPSFVIWAVWIAYALGMIALRIGNRPWFYVPALIFLILIPPVVYYETYRTAERSGTMLSFVRKLPYRNNSRYYFFPPKQFEYGAARYVEDSFNQAAEHATILSDFNPGMALRYGQEVLGQRTDLTIEVLVDEWVRSEPNSPDQILKYLREEVQKNRKVVYLADDWEAYYHASAIRKEFTLIRSGGPLWELRLR